MQILKVPIAVFFLAALPSSFLQAQVARQESSAEAGVAEHTFAVGVGGGSASGVGLSFRHHFPGRFSYQLTGGIVGDNDNLSYAFGGEVQLDLTRTSGTRLYAAAAAGYYYSGPKGGTNEMDGPGRLGLGVGVEFVAAGDVHLQLDLLFTYFSDSTVLPLPQIALYYYFR